VAPTVRAAIISKVNRTATQSFIEQTLSFVLALFIFAGIIWLAIYLKARHARLKAERLRIEIGPLYQQYLAHLEKLRAKHDPEHKWKRHPIAERDLRLPWKGFGLLGSKASQRVLV
jgi:hypothetical protein